MTEYKHYRVCFKHDTLEVWATVSVVPGKDILDTVQCRTMLDCDFVVDSAVEVAPADVVTRPSEFPI